MDKTKMTKFSIEFTEQEIERLKRLDPNASWQDALNNHIKSLIGDKVGRPSIFGHSNKGRVKVPTLNGDYN